MILKRELRKVLRELSIQEAIIELLAKRLKATVEKKHVTVRGKHKTWILSLHGDSGHVSVRRLSLTLL